MLANATTEAPPTSPIPEALNPSRLVLTPLLVRILALVAVMLLAQIP